MRLVPVASASIVAGVAVGVAGLTGVDTDPVAWSFACQPRAEAPCGPGLGARQGVLLRLWTHCGVGAAIFDGRLWMARPEDRHSVGVGANVTEGTMRLLARNRAEFRSGSLVSELEVASLESIPPCY